MKRITMLLSAAAFVLAGCEVSNPVEVQEKEYPDVFTTVLETQPVTKTYINGSDAQVWNASDALSIFRSTKNEKYLFHGSDGANQGMFIRDNSVPFELGDPITRNFAVYPYSDEAQYLGNDKLHIVLPAVQPYAANSFAQGVNTLVACTSNRLDNSLALKNVCGWLVVSLYGNSNVKSVTLKGNAGERIAGSATVTCEYGGDPTLTMDPDATSLGNTITIDCGTGVAIGATEALATDFWFCIPPVTFSQGFTVTVTDVNGDAKTQSTDVSRAITRGTRNSMTALEVHTGPEPPEVSNAICFAPLSNETTTISLSAIGGYVNNTLEYSTDATNWTELSGSDLTPAGIELATMSNTGDRFFIRAKEKRTDGQDGMNYIQFITSGAPLKVSGNIMYLVDPDGGEAYTMKSYEFSNLFKECKTIADAGDLVLPATTMAEYCYSSMFMGCTSLEKAPALPATTLAKDCYNGMFSGCTSLQEAPVLPATTLVAACYFEMFYGCTSLNSITCLAADANGCTTQWLYNVAETGTFTKAIGVNWSRGVDGIPTGWTIASEGAPDVSSLPETVVIDLNFYNAAAPNTFSNPFGFSDPGASFEDATTGEQYFVVYNFTDSKTGNPASTDFPFTVCKSSSAAGATHYYYSRHSNNEFGLGYVLDFDNTSSWIGFPAIEGKYLSTVEIRTGNTADKEFNFKTSGSATSSIAIVKVLRGSSAPGSATLHFYTDGNDGTNASLTGNTAEISTPYVLQCRSTGGTRIAGLTLTYTPTLPTR